MSETKRRHFAVVILPVVQRYARRKFRLFNYEEREERVAEATAAAFVSYVSLVRRGKDERVKARSLAYFAIKHVRNRRHVGGVQDRSKDALTPREGACIVRFGHPYELPPVLREALCENTRSPVPDQAAFRIDFSEFLRGQNSKKRKLAILLAQGHQGTIVAQRARISPGRVTQIRQELHREWEASTE